MFSIARCLLFVAAFSSALAFAQSGDSVWSSGGGSDLKGDFVKAAQKEINKLKSLPNAEANAWAVQLENTLRQENLAIRFPKTLANACDGKAAEEDYGRSCLGEINILENYAGIHIIHGADPQFEPGYEMKMLHEIAIAGDPKAEWYVSRDINYAFSGNISDATTEVPRNTVIGYYYRSDIENVECPEEVTVGIYVDLTGDPWLYVVSQGGQRRHYSIGFKSGSGSYKNGKYVSVYSKKTLVGANTGLGFRFSPRIYRDTVTIVGQEMTTLREMLVSEPGAAKKIFVPVPALDFNFQPMCKFTKVGA